MENFILMNQNKEVLKFEFDKNLNVITKIIEVYDINFAPFNIKNISDDKKLYEFNNWFSDRGIPNFRDDVKDILEMFNVNNTRELINKDYALSLSDMYWFKPENSKLEWSNINYFENEYDSFAFIDATYGSGAGEFLNRIQKGDSSRTPNNTSNGQLKKVWVRKDGGNFLYKAANTVHNFEPINEWLASKICEILDVPFVDYSLEVIRSKRQDVLVSVCKCAIDENEEIIPAHSILTERLSEVTKTIKDYYLYLEILEAHNVPRAEEYLQKMFMLDYITLNEDRHLGNFGVVRDVKTLEWKRICPIFDTGRSMNTNVTTSYWDFEEGEVKCFTNEFISSKNLEQLFTFKVNMRQIEKLKDLASEYKNMLVKYRECTKLTDEEIKRLEEGYWERVRKFEAICCYEN